MSYLIIFILCFFIKGWKKAVRTLAFLKTMKTCVENLKIVQRWSSAVIWFEFVYVCDFDEDPEDLFIFYNSIDKERIKKNTSALQGLQGYTWIHNIKPNHD